jgi:hypothetical protein
MTAVPRAGQFQAAPFQRKIRDRPKPPVYPTAQALRAEVTVTP